MTHAASVIETSVQMSIADAFMSRMRWTSPDRSEMSIARGERRRRCSTAATASGSTRRSTEVTAPWSPASFAASASRA